jgi:hypothetical protein
MASLSRASPVSHRAPLNRRQRRGFERLLYPPDVDSALLGKAFPVTARCEHGHECASTSLRLSYGMSLNEAEIDYVAATD